MEEKRMLFLAEAFLAAWTSQDVERVLDCYTKDLIYTDPSTRGPVRGVDAMRRYLTKLFAAWKMTWSVREVSAELGQGIFGFAGQEGCALLWHATFEHHGGDGGVEADGMDLVLLSAERIRRNDVFFDRSVLAVP